MKIDVIVLTKNSEKILEKCLTSIYREIPVCHLIVVDGFSTDGTLEILAGFGQIYGNAKIIRAGAKLGEAREIGIENVDSPWFAFIDSDVILRPGWLEKIAKHIREGDRQIGAVEGGFVHHYPEGTPKFPQSSPAPGRGASDTRGYTIATLVKKDVVQGIKIPHDLAIYEDQFIKRWVERQGFAWLKVADPVVDHFPRPRPFRDAYLAGVYSVRHDLLPVWRIIAATLFSPLKFVYLAYRTGSPRASLNSVIYSFYMLRGVIEEVFGIAKG